MTTATVSDKGQVVIPASIRRSLGIRRGCQLEFHLEGNTTRLNAPKRDLNPFLYTKLIVNGGLSG